MSHRANSSISNVLGFAILTLVVCLAPQQALAGTTSAYASGWSVNNNADWTPYPPNSNPLGAADSNCTGASTPTGSWAEFTFGAFSIPAGELVVGVEVKFKLKSGSTNTAQLKNGSTLVGSTRSVPAHSTGPSYCSNTVWKTSGGSSDLWGTSLTRSDFNSGNVSVRITQNANTIDLDSVEMIVHHETRQYASGWTVNNNADWTPFPPNSNPLGAPDDNCTGASTPTGSWAEFTFPAFAIPTGDTISGVEIRFNYLSASGTNTAQLKKSGTLTGSTRTVPSKTGSSYCSNTGWVSSGGSSDLWGATLTPADFNSGNVSVRLTQDANTVDLDSVEMIVYH